MQRKRLLKGLQLYFHKSTQTYKNRPRKRRSEVVETPVAVVRTHVGLQKILEWAGKESGIDEDLKASLELGDAQKLSSIGRYWGDTLPRMETWQVMNLLPYEYPMTQDVYGKLFATVGRNDCFQSGKGVSADVRRNDKLPPKRNEN